MTVSTVAPPRPDGHGPRVVHRLAVAWQHPTTRSIQPVGMLATDGSLYRFHYIRNVYEVPDFRPFVGFPELGREYKSRHLFPLFRQRVMDSRRSDFARYVDTLNLTTRATPWEQLARSEGRRVGDTIMVFPEPVVNLDGETTYIFLVHGIRHLLPGSEPALTALHVGDSLRIVDQQDNPKNPRAMLVSDYSARPIGWVPDMLLDYVRTVRHGASPALCVEHLNGPEAPTHLRVLVRLSGTVSAGYNPFAGDMWGPVG